MWPAEGRSWCCAQPRWGAGSRRPERWVGPAWPPCWGSGWWACWRLRKRGKRVFYKNQRTGKLQTKQKSFCFLFLPALYKPVAAKYPSVNHNKMPEPEWRSAPQRISEKKSAENTHASAIVVKKSGLLKKSAIVFFFFFQKVVLKKVSSKRF